MSRDGVRYFSSCRVDMYPRAIRGQYRVSIDQLVFVQYFVDIGGLGEVDTETVREKEARVVGVPAEEGLPLRVVEGQ